MRRPSPLPGNIHGRYRLKPCNHDFDIELIKQGVGLNYTINNEELKGMFLASIRMVERGLTRRNI